jgi:glycosyltransferase involved in cell wall biosynthesis
LEDALHNSLSGWDDYVIVPGQWWENSPLVIREAHAAGRPVIAANLGDIA